MITNLDIDNKSKRASRTYCETNKPHTRSFQDSTHIESFANPKLYKKFLNWVSGEFDLFLQIEENDLQIFFPNGSLHIKEQNINSNTITAEIKIKSKNPTVGINILNQITSITNHLKNIYSL